MSEPVSPSRNCGLSRMPLTIAGLLRSYAAAFAATDEGLTLAPENWNNLRALLIEAADALSARSETASGVHGVNMPSDLQPATAQLVLRFAQALAEKLHAAEKKYGYDDGWAESGWKVECQRKLAEHVHKGDPRDVAAYCAFMWHHGWRTREIGPSDAQPSTGRPERWVP